MYSAASGLVQGVIIISITSFDKPPLNTSSYISSCFARGIPHFLLEPTKELTLLSLLNIQMAYVAKQIQRNLKIKQEVN